MKTQESSRPPSQNIQKYRTQATLHFEVRKKPTKRKVDPNRVLKKIQKNERKKYHEIKFDPVMLNDKVLAPPAVNEILKMAQLKSP